MITIIAAVAENNALGKDNQLIWHLPSDLKRFKKVTSNHHVIMGRKTYESLGNLFQTEQTSSFPEILISKQQVVLL